MAASDIIVESFDPTGKTIFSKTFGDTGVQAGTGVAVDGAGNVVLAANVSSVVDFGGGPLNGFPGDAAVAKLDPSGKHIFSKRFGEGSNQTFSGVAVELLGNVLLTGLTRGTVDFGGGALGPGAADDDIVVVKLSP